MFKTTLKSTLVLMGIAYLTACGSAVRPGAIGSFFNPAGNGSQPVVENPGNGGDGTVGFNDILVFATVEIYNGNFAKFAAEGSATPARDGADFLCEQYRTSKMEGRTIRALISIDRGDHLENMPKNFDISYDKPLIGDLGLTIADNWADLIDQSIQTSLEKAVSSLNTAGGYYWTGSDVDGFTDASNNCLNWTSESSSDFGASGLSSYEDAFWLAAKNEDCKHFQKLVCIAY